jgi:hypothetical protein
MAKARAEACFDGPRIAMKVREGGSRVGGFFSNLLPEAQYRFEVVRGVSAAAGVVKDPFGLLEGSGLGGGGGASVGYQMRALDIRTTTLTRARTARAVLASTATRALRRTTATTGQTDSTGLGKPIRRSQTEWMEWLRSL